MPKYEMRKLRMYLDTSVISYLDQTDVPDKMRQTHELWELIKNDCYEIVISNVVLEEINKCNVEKRNILYSYLNEIKYEFVKVDNKIMKIADKIIDFDILTKKSYEDCQHIAAAIVSRCDVIVSWNLKHIASIKTGFGIRKITTAEGYNDLMVYPPYGILEGEYENGIPIY